MLLSGKPRQVVLNSLSSQFVELPPLSELELQRLCSHAFSQHCGETLCVRSEINGGGKSHFIQRCVAAKQREEGTMPRAKCVPLLGVYVCVCFSWCCLSMEKAIIYCIAFELLIRTLLTLHPCCAHTGDMLYWRVPFRESSGAASLVKKLGSVPDFTRNMFHLVRLFTTAL